MFSLVHSTVRNHVVFHLRLYLNFRFRVLLTSSAWRRLTSVRTRKVKVNCLNTKKLMLSQEIARKQLSTKRLQIWILGNERKHQIQVIVCTFLLSIQKTGTKNICMIRTYHKTGTINMCMIRTYHCYTLNWGASIKIIWFLLTCSKERKEDLVTYWNLNTMNNLWIDYCSSSS